MYKDRDDRTLVMDKVYDDFVYVLANMRVIRYIRTIPQ